MNAVLNPFQQLSPKNNARLRALKVVSLAAEWSPVSESPQTLVTLLESVKTAEPALKNQIEEILVELGPVIKETLFDGLSHEHLNVRSTCAMVLVRLGHMHHGALKRYAQHADLTPSTRWAIDFVLEHTA